MRHQATTDLQNGGGHQLAARRPVWLPAVRKVATATLILGVAGWIGVALGKYLGQPTPSVGMPATITIHSVALTKEAAGSFRINGKLAAPPIVTQPPLREFEIMQFQVSQRDYAACVAEAGCPPSMATGTPDLPQTQVSFTDADAYARWFSRRTGTDCRLPDDSEWLAAAGERVTQPEMPDENSSSDISNLWLRQYRATVVVRGDTDPVVHPHGSFGQNRNGVADMAGNIWEWTSTCFDRINLAPDAATELSRTPNCGVRVAQGKHRAYVVDFVRDARAGGCAAGLPPDFLGFRLVREPD